MHFEHRISCDTDPGNPEAPHRADRATGAPITSHTLPRIRPADSKQLQPPLRVPNQLSVAATTGSDVVHLAAINHVVPSPWTLCAQIVGRDRPRRLFQDSGCGVCATVALGGGYAAAQDGHGATVNLSRWSARKPAGLEQR